MVMLAGMRKGGPPMVGQQKGAAPGVKGVQVRGPTVRPGGVARPSVGTLVAKRPFGVASPAQPMVQPMLAHNPVAKRAKGPGGAPIMMAQPSSGGRTMKTTGFGEEFGEVRFDSVETAHQAVEQGHGSILGDRPLTVHLDNTSPEGTKVLVRNLPAGIAWQELKDHFGQIGTVEFAAISNGMASGGAGMLKSSGADDEFGEVRFDSAEAAEMAVQHGDGSILGGSRISAELDTDSKDGTKVVIRNLPAGIGWQELKDHFSNMGAVEFAAISGKASRLEGVVPGGSTAIGEVRYDDPEHASSALRSLNGTELEGCKIWIQADSTSQDSSKLIVLGLSPRTKWQELKDHFGTIGQVAYAGVRPPAQVPVMQQPMMPFMAMQAMQPAMMQMPRGPVQRMPMARALGEVRYQAAIHAQQAVSDLNGAMLAGGRIRVQLDSISKDGTKIIVFDVPINCTGEQLKGLFSSVGPVAFAAIKHLGGNVVQQQPQQFVQQAQFAVMPQMQQMGFRPMNLGLPRKPLGPRTRPDGPQQAEVRFSSAGSAQEAVQQLHNASLRGAQISVQLDPRSQDGSKVYVTNIPQGAALLEVRDLCAQFGNIAFVGMIGLGEARFGTPEMAQRAAESLNGQVVEGFAISVRTDPLSQDGTKILIDNLPPSFKWQEIKDYFGCIGPVEYAARDSSK